MTAKPPRSPRPTLTDRLSALVPPGTPLSRQLALFFTAMGGCAAFSLWFLIRLAQARAALFVPDRLGRPTGMLRPGALLPDFAALARPCLLPLRILPLAAAGLALWYFLSYRAGGSRADYLMRRLPRRGLMARQCLTVPLLLTLLCAAAAVLLTLLFFILYLTAAPEGTLPPAAPTMLWSVLL